MNISIWWIWLFFVSHFKSMMQWSLSPSEVHHLHLKAILKLHCDSSSSAGVSTCTVQMLLMFFFCLFKCIYFLSLIVLKRGSQWPIRLGGYLITGCHICVGSSPKSGKCWGSVTKWPWLLNRKQKHQLCALIDFKGSWGTSLAEQYCLSGNYGQNKNLWKKNKC